MPGYARLELILGLLVAVALLLVLAWYIDRMAEKNRERLTEASKSDILNQTVVEHMLRQEAKIRMLEQLLDERSKDWNEQS